MTSERLDLLLVSRGLAASRTAAARAVADGLVLVGGVAATRPGARVASDADLALRGRSTWVGRAAGKLDAALDAFAVDPSGRLALDLGASTGGFTQVLLERGARRVIALDVGHGQLDPRIRADPRVAVLEGVNARDLDAARLQSLTGSRERPSLVVADLSFISLTLVLPAIAAVADGRAEVVLLVKPQFEVGRGRARHGVVRRPEDRVTAVIGVLAAAAEAGLGPAGVLASPVVGAAGNREVLVLLRRPGGWDPAEWTPAVERAVRHGEGERR